MLFCIQHQGDKLLRTFVIIVNVCSADLTDPALSEESDSQFESRDCESTTFDHCKVVLN